MWSLCGVVTTPQHPPCRMRSLLPVFCRFRRLSIAVRGRAFTATESSESVPGLNLDVLAALQQGPTLKLREDRHYNVVVIGGGSGGIACAKALQASSSDLSVLLADYVSPSPTRGSTWDIGGMYLMTLLSLFHR